MRRAVHYGHTPAPGAGWRRPWCCSRKRKRSAWSWAIRTVCSGATATRPRSCKPGAGLEEAMALLKKQEVLCLELGNRSGLAYCYWYWGLLNPHDTCEELCRDPKHCPSRECERQEESAHNTNISKPLGWRIFASHWVVLLLLATEKGLSPASSQGKR